MNRDLLYGETVYMIKHLNEQRDSILTKSIQWDSSWPELARGDDRRHIFSFLKSRFGIDEDIFDDYLLLAKKKSWWLFKDSELIIPSSQFKVWKVGLKAFQKVGHFLKPSTRFIQLFGYMAVKSRLDIDERGLKRLLTGKHLSVDMDIGNGYVILFYKACSLGLGLLINGEVRSQLPVKEIRDSML